MISKISILAFSFLFTMINSCESSTVSLHADLSGSWTLKKVFLSDAYDTPCGSEVGDHRPLTISFEEKEGKISFSGNSAINGYFGSLEVLSFDKTTESGTLETGPIASTKKAGPPELSQCESRFLNQLDSATDFSFQGENELVIGNSSSEENQARDGGYFLVFERSE